jgi:multicomponent Na+:H+ antiporter subunit C
VTLLLAITVGLLFAAGVYLLLQRTPARLVVGLMLLGNGANLGVFVAGGLVRGRPPLVAAGAAAPPPGTADPLPQALVLTAIVIGFAVTALAAVLVWRAHADRADAGGRGGNDLDELRSTDT